MKETNERNRRVLRSFEVNTAADALPNNWHMSPVVDDAVAAVLARRMVKRNPPTLPGAPNITIVRSVAR